MAARPLRDAATGRAGAGRRRSSCGRPRRSPRALAELAELGEPRAARPTSCARLLGELDVPRLARPGRGPGADRQPLPAARRPLRPRLRRLPAGRRVPAPRPRRRPLPLRGAAARRSGSTRAATPRPRSATSSTPAWRCRAAASVLSYRDSDEDGAAEARSPLLDEVRRLLDPAAGGSGADPVEAAITAAATWPQVVRAAGRGALGGRAGARARRRTAPAPTRAALLAAAGSRASCAARIGRRLDAAAARRGGLAARPGR